MPRRNIDRKEEAEAWKRLPKNGLSRLLDEKSNEPLFCGREDCKNCKDCPIKEKND